MTVRELGDRMDSREAAEWIAYWRIEPRPDSWEQAGLLASLMWNLSGRSKKVREPEDFIPRRRPTARESAVASLARAKAWAAAMRVRMGGGNGG